MIPDPDSLVILLTQGIGQRKMYFPDHPKVLAVSKDFPAQLIEYLEIENHNSFFIGIVDGKLVHNGKYLIGPTIVGSKLSSFAQNLQCGGFLFRMSVSNEEMISLFNLAAEITEPIAHLEEARSLLRDRDIRNIELSPLYEDPDHFGKRDNLDSTFELENDSKVEGMFICQNLFDSVDTAHTGVSMGFDSNIDQARENSQNLVAGTKDGFMDIMQLVHYPDFDTYTVGHSVRVALLAVLVGQRMELADHMLLELCMAGLLHDVGKSQIPDEILFKPGRLDDEERALMETHAQAGAEILMGHDKASPLAIAGAWGHHLRHDGGGYPNAPEWAARHFLTQLLQVCDVFEALTAIRPYKPPFPPRRVYEIMVSDKGAFDPTAFGVFVRAVGLYPPGSGVILSNGAKGVVIDAGPDPEKPCVLITADQEGNSIPEDDQEYIDLGGENAEALEVVELAGA